MHFPSPLPRSLPSFFPFFFHSFNKYLLRAYSEPGTVTRTKDKMMSCDSSGPSSRGIHSLVGEMEMNKKNNNKGKIATLRRATKKSYIIKGEPQMGRMT